MRSFSLLLLPFVAFLGATVLLGADDEHRSAQTNTGESTTTVDREGSDRLTPEERRALEAWVAQDSRPPPPPPTEEELARATRRMRVLREGGEFDDDGDGKPDLIVKVHPDGTSTHRLRTLSGWATMEFSKDGEAIVEGQTVSSRFPSHPLRRVSEVFEEGKLRVYTVEADTDSDGVFDERTTFDLVRGTMNNWKLEPASGEWVRDGEPDAPLPLIELGCGEPLIELR